MAIIAKNESGGDFYEVPPGTYIGRCFSVIDCGTYATSYQGKPRERHELRVTWEIPGEIIQRGNEEKPAIISKTYTLSLNEKAALRHDLEAWRGKVFTPEELNGFDVAKLIGAPCTLTVAQKTGDDNKTRSVVAGVGKLGKGMQCPDLINKAFEFSVSEGRNDRFKSLPDWLQEKLSKCLEWTSPPPAEPPAPAETAPGAAEQDDVPF